MMGSPFARKRLRTAEFRFEVEDSTAAAAALKRARNAAFLARVQKTEHSDELERAAAEAQKAYDDCFEVVRFRQNTSAVQLLEQRRAEVEPARADDYHWWSDAESYEVGLIAASAVDLDWSPEQWCAELGEDRWTIQDRRDLLAAAFEANMRVAYDAGKG